LPYTENIGPAHIRILDYLRIEEIERVLERRGRPVSDELCKEVNAAASSPLVHTREIEVIAQPNHTIPEGMNAFGIDVAVLVLDLDPPPPLAGARNDNLHFSPKVTQLE